MFNQSSLVDLIRNLGNHDAVAVLSLAFDRGASTHGDGAAACLVSLPNPAPAVNDSCGGEIRTRNMRHNVAERGVWIVNQMNHGLTNFRQIVRRHVGRHTDSNTIGAVDQKIRDFARQIRRFLALFIIIGDEVHGLFVDIFEKCLCKRRHARFRISHRRRRIAVY